MGVHGEKERNEEMVRVPEGLKTLGADLGVRGRVHEQHAQDHDVPGDAAGLGVVDLDGGFGTDLTLLHIEKVDVVAGGVDDGPE